MIILLPLLTLLPGVTDALRSSPVLRLIRLVWLITLGVRVSGVAIRHRAVASPETAAAAPVQITLMADAPEFSPGPASWEDLMQWLRSPGREWFHVSNPSREQLGEMAIAAGLPAGFLEMHLLGTNYPHVASTRKFVALFLWLPELTVTGQVERYGVLFVASKDSLLSLARRATHAVERITAPAAEKEAEKTPFALRMLGHVLERVMQRNENVIGGFEHELRALEDVPIRESSPAFFERTFRLKKELSATQADLWRLKGLLRDLPDEWPAAQDGAEAMSALFRRLSTDAEYPTKRSSTCATKWYPCSNYT